jgi:hypothetical protein
MGKNKGKNIFIFAYTKSSKASDEKDFYYFSQQHFFLFLSIFLWASAAQYCKNRLLYH